ncbi:IS4 family transposase [Pseudomonas daroniae]|uniref:IS4 family transposase n=1 Tax=Phytopseudomonas daroniae TaxID=2487519 RepID=A0A4Q9QM05_9GAMM|nr:MULTISPECIES: IS4 family transposase [Pseudomonas]TBU80336.1 IS4 family transposase [Pseudomonas daroniae]TBU85546.1 IS4 family transposase [Pseudomonas sp. FRB 228]TBU94394.1 IS4 family transposase [Pseudomonas daroniae]
MQAVRFLHNAFSQAFPTVHDKRLNALMSCVSALLQGHRLTLTDLGRAIPSKAYTKHSIKRVDRLLGNAQLQSERLLFYWKMLKALIGNLPQPVILVDWSPINAASDLYLLRASIPLAGRAFPIYEAVHEREGCPKRQCQLLDALTLMLPEHCRPILVTDAGFRRPWFQAVEARGWYYVGRVRNRDLYRNQQGQWQPIKQLYEQATPVARSLGPIEITRSAPHLVPLYCVHQPPKGRKHRRVTGSVARSKLSRQSARREQEPWLLASNLAQSQWTARSIVAIYRKRMQIEEGFRDVKSLRFGFAFDLHRTRCPRRIEILLLIAALACYVLYLAGLRARTTGQSRRFQSNSVRHKPVLSLWRVGLEYLRRSANDLPNSVLAEMELLLRDEVRRQAQQLE